MVDLHAGREEKLRDAIELFYFAYRAFTAGPDHILETQGLGRVHHRILYFVGRHPHLSVNALLQILAVSKQALNAPLRHLVERKLVVLRADEHDRRVRRLALSGEGRKLEAHLTGTQLKLMAAVFAATGSPAHAGWNAVMREITQCAGSGRSGGPDPTMFGSRRTNGRVNG
jgi:DNA-binding MarR family transcriptional regulator